MSISLWEHFFKPEVRSSGQVFVSKGKVVLAQPSETEIQAYIRASSSYKVTLKSESVSSDTITADCNCPLFKKGQLCKHIWATLLVVENKKPDFLDSKTEIEKKSQPLFENLTKSTQSHEAFKIKQADYRKEQYQKQKERLNDIKNSKKKNYTAIPDFPPTVELALKYFSENGFPLRESLNKASLGIATRKLARIFHPDIGGSHSEILELNKFSEILEKFAKS